MSNHKSWWKPILMVESTASDRVTHASNRSISYWEKSCLILLPITFILNETPPKELLPEKNLGLYYFDCQFFPLSLQLLSNTVNSSDILRLIPQTSVPLQALKTFITKKCTRFLFHSKAELYTGIFWRVFILVPSSTSCLVHIACLLLSKSENLSDNREVCLTSQPNQFHSRHASPDVKENSDPYLPLKGEGSMQVLNISSQTAKTWAHTDSSSAALT